MQSLGKPSMSPFEYPIRCKDCGALFEDPHHASMDYYESDPHYMDTFCPKCGSDDIRYLMPKEDLEG